MTSETNERLARIETILETHLPEIHKRLDKLSEIPLSCAKNNERIGNLEREHRNVKKGIWGVIGSSLVAVVGVLVSWFVQR